MYVVDQRELDVLEGILKFSTTWSKYGASTVNRIGDSDMKTVFNVWV